MVTGIRYTQEFKQEAVNQVAVHGYPGSEQRLITGMFG
jgi:transposase-like protein